MVTRSKPVVCILLMMLSSLVLSGDLDDGIGGDEKIDDELNLDKNLPYTIRKAQSKAKSGENKGCEGTGNIKVGPGATIKGDIVNVSKNKNASSVCIVK